MSKLLSQEEVDALLSQGEMGEKLGLDEPEKELRLYDFRRPERVSKDQIKILRNIHEIFARLLSPFLSNTLRTMVDVKSPVIDQVTYLEFTMSASDYTNMYIFEIDKLDGQAILDIDPDLTNFIIDRLFGGTGSAIARRTETITLIEQSVMRNIADKILEHFQEAWQQIDELQPRIVQFEVNPQLVTIAPSSETMVVLNFPVVARSFEFTILLCFPYFMLEPVLKKLLSQNYMTLLKKESTEEDLTNLKHTIEQTSVDLSVELGEMTISVEEFLLLEEGNILVIDRMINEQITAKIAGTPRFKGVAGVHHKKLAFLVQHLIDREGEIMDERKQS